MTDRSAAPGLRTISDRYDRALYTPVYIDYYGQSDFANFGYWDASTSSPREASERLIDELLGFIPEKRGPILDVACGKGASTRHLLNYFAPRDVIGINISRKQLTTCRLNAPRCQFLLMDAAVLAFPDSSFNNLLCVEAAFHFHTRENFLREAHRVLKPGGHLVLADILLSRDGHDRGVIGSSENFVGDPGAYASLLEKAGFRDNEVIDATEECWKRYFRFGVSYFHEKFLNREIDLSSLQTFLSLGYRRVDDLEYYVLAAARKNG